MSDEPSPVAQLSRPEAEALALRVAEVTSAGLPLAEGLESAASEVGSRRLAQGLRALAKGVRQGQSLDATIRAIDGVIPGELAALLTAAEKSGHLGVVLEEWAEHKLAAKVRWRRLTAALAYPAICLSIALCVLLVVSVYVIPQFRTMFQDFALQLPEQTIVLFAIVDYVPIVVGVALGTLVVVALGMRLIGGSAGWYWLWSQAPLIGKVWYWSSVAEGLRVASLLVEQRMPLPAALSLAGEGMLDTYVGGAYRSLARQSEAGLPLWSGMLRDRKLPLSLVPLLRSGEQTGELAASLRSGAEMLERRIEQRCDLIAVVVPPILFIALAIAVVTILSAIFMPVIALIRGLGF